MNIQTKGWNHIEDETTRKVLTLDGIPTPKDIEHAISVAHNHWTKDLHNEAIPTSVFSARTVALDSAESFHRIPYPVGAITCLKLYWAV